MKYMYIVYEIVDKCSNADHKAIKMKPVDVKSSTYGNVEHNEKYLKCNVGDHLKIRKYKIICKMLHSK